MYPDTWVDCKPGESFQHWANGKAQTVIARHVRLKRDAFRLARKYAGGIAVREGMLGGVKAGWVVIADKI